MTDLAAAPRRRTWTDRTGYDPSFLGPVVPMPAVTTDVADRAAARTSTTPSLFRPDRKFAALTALVLDGQLLQSLPRNDRLAARSPARRRAAGRPAGLRPQRPRPRPPGHARVVDAGGDRRRRPGRPRPTRSTSPTPRRRRRRSTRAGSSGWASRSTCRSTPPAFDRKLAVFAGPGPRPRRPAVPGDPDPAAVLEGRGVRAGRRAGRHRLPPRPDPARRRPRRSASPRPRRRDRAPARRRSAPSRCRSPTSPRSPACVLDQLALVDRLGAPSPGVAPPPGAGRPPAGRSSARWRTSS